MTATGIALYLAALAAVYFAGYTWGHVVRWISDMGRVG